MKRALYTVLLSVLLVANAVVFADFYLYYRNSLHENGNWISSKVKLARRPLASVAFLVTNVTLAHNRINLASWQGFQEIIHVRPMDLASLEMDVFVSDSDHYSLVTVFDRHAGGFSGFALHNPRIRKSKFFHATSLGRFTSKKSAGPGGQIQNGTWNRLKLEFTDEHVAVQINGEAVGRQARKVKGARQFGFRVDSIGDEALLDNIVARDRQGRTFEETFDNRRHLPWWILGFLAALLLVNAALFWFTRKGNPWPRLVLLNVVLAASVSGLYAYYYYNLSVLYPREEAINWRGFKNRLEGEHDMAMRQIKKHGTKKGPGEYRVMLIGSSQTWGEGASLDKYTLAQFVERALNKQRALPGKTFRCINAGVRGAESSGLSQVYKEQLLKLKPDLLVVNLSNMDQDGKILTRSLELFISLNRARGIKTVLSLEPSMTYDEELKKKHAVVRAVAAKHRLTVIESQAHLASKRGDGFLWWDGVHLSDYGQQLLSVRMVQGIKKALAAGK